jgi:hypothetical protein
MELRIYTGMVSSLGIKQCIERIEQSLGFAKRNNFKVTSSGIVAVDLLKGIKTKSENYNQRMNQIVVNHKTFETMNESWVVFNYLAKKVQNLKTTQGVLYSAGLFPYEDRTPFDTVSLITCALSKKHGILAIIVNTGRSSRTQFDELVTQIAVAIKSEGQPSLVVLDENQLIDLADVYRTENHNIASSTISTFSSEITIKNLENIFADSTIQKVDDDLELTKNITRGSWKSLVFRISEPGYYLGMSKFFGTIGLFPMSRSESMNKLNLLPILNHIMNRIQQIHKLTYTLNLESML